MTICSQFLILGVTASLLTPVNAQTLNTPLPHASHLQILQYLQSDFFIRPGVGLRGVFLGQAISAALEELGKPVNGRRNFKLDEETNIRVEGRKRVKRIQISATDGSRYRTRQGARFGMRLAEVTGIYGKASSKNKRGELYYPQQGIGFKFSANKLRTVMVFPVKR